MKKNVAEFLEFRYEKLKLLKRSERGEVWLASTRQGGELVILKRVMLTGLPYDTLKKFQFTLPAKIFFCAADESETIIVEEFIHGENLLERLEQKNFLNESQARSILLQMCDGLRELHAQKIIHRDIKPSNLILQGERIRLIDFDAARLFKDGQESDTNLLGTKGYAPPEQFGSGQTDPRSDIYSLGVTMKILLGGHCGRLKRILDRCTELDPKNRFQSVDELKSALTVSEPNICGKIFASLILLTAILLVNIPPLNRDENFSEVVSRVEVPVVEKIPATIEETPAPKKFTLPTIKLPPIEIEQPSPPQVQPVEKKSASEEFTLPKIDIPPEALKPVEIPQPTPQPSPLPAPKKFSGMLKTEFFMNGAPLNQFDYISDNMKITRAELLRSNVRLRITNDTDRVWQKPTIKFILGQNWGDKVTDTKSLPNLSSGESADFVIPFDALTLSDRANTHAYIQIWLNGDESKMDEHYWCIWFDVTD